MSHKNCISCKERILEAAFKCKECGSFQLKYFWFQPFLLSAAVLSTIVPLAIIAIGFLQNMMPANLSFEVLSTDINARTISVSVNNNTSKPGVVRSSSYELSDGRMVRADLKPMVIAANSIEVLSLDFSRSKGWGIPMILSDIRQVDKEFLGFAVDEGAYWADDDECRIFFVVKEDRVKAKNVVFKCAK